MRVYALWNGGANYSPSSVPDDVESFPSLSSAMQALEERYNSNGQRPVTFHYVNKAEDSTYCPAVDIESSMWLYLADPTNEHDPYPDRIVTLSRNVRAHVERA